MVPIRPHITALVLFDTHHCRFLSAPRLFDCCITQAFLGLSLDNRAHNSAQPNLAAGVAPLCALNAAALLDLVCFCFKLLQLCASVPLMSLTHTSIPSHTPPASCLPAGTSIVASLHLRGMSLVHIVVPPWVLPASDVSWVLPSSEASKDVPISCWRSLVYPFFHFSTPSTLSLLPPSLDGGPVCDLLGDVPSSLLPSEVACSELLPFTGVFLPSFLPSSLLPPPRDDPLCALLGLSVFILMFKVLFSFSLESSCDFVSVLNEELASCRTLPRILQVLLTML